MEDPRERPLPGPSWWAGLLSVDLLLVGASSAAVLVADRLTGQALGFVDLWLAVFGALHLALAGWTWARRNRMGTGEATALLLLVVVALSAHGALQPVAVWTWLSVASLEVVPLLAAPLLRRRALVAVAASSTAGAVALVAGLGLPAVLLALAVTSATVLALAPAGVTALLARRLDQAAARAEVAATTDELTRLLNRYGMRRRSTALIARCAEEGLLACVVIADLDRFRAVNDEHGHLVGDRVLTAAAGAIRTVSRAEDLVVRLGGEEIVIVAGIISSTDAEGLAQRLRRAVEGVDVPGLPRTTASVGVAVSSGWEVDAAADPGSEDAAAELVSHLVDVADTALRSAKRAGRNKVRVAKAEAAQATVSRP